MEFSLFKVRIKIDFSFVFILIAAVFFGYDYLPQILLFSVLHEAGHIIALYFFKAPPYRIVFSFFGIGLKYENRLSPPQEAIMTAAGPFVNLLLYLFLHDEVNLFLLFINLFPAFPLDGGRILKCAFPSCYKAFSLVCIIILLAVSVFLLIEYKIFSLLFIAVYLLIFNMRSL